MRSRYINSKTGVQVYNVDSDLFDGGKYWVNTANWHKVNKKSPKQTVEGLANSFGRVFERRDYVLCEDERDAVLYRLSLT